MAYRSFGGNSDLSLTKIWDNNEVSSSASTPYRIDHASLLFRAIRAEQLGKFTFFSWGPGLNFDYHISDDREMANQLFENAVQDYKLQFHLQFGLGIRMTEGLIFQPQIELPLLEIYEFGKWTPYQEFAGGEHYPFLLSFRFLLLRKDPMNCNAPTFN